MLCACVWPYALAYAHACDHVQKQLLASNLLNL